MFGNNDGFDSFDQLFELDAPKKRAGTDNRGRSGRTWQGGPDLLDDPDPVESWSLNDFSDLLDTH